MLEVIHNIAKLNSAQLKLQLQLELSIALISFFSLPPTRNIIIIHVPEEKLTINLRIL